MCGKPQPGITLGKECEGAWQCGIFLVCGEADAIHDV